MLEVAVVIGVVGLLISFADWRKGIMIAVVVGFLQDPLRKLAEGEPVYFVVLVGVFFGAAFIGALNRGMPLSLRPFYTLYPLLKTPLNLFLLLVAIQIGMTVVRTGSIVLGGIGAITYFTPLLALLVAFYFGLRDKDVNRLMHIYIALAALMLVGVYLSVNGYDWRLLDSVGVGLYIYPDSGGVLKLPSGFFRAPENAAWHGATAVSLLVIMVVSRSWKGGTWLAAAIGFFILGAVLFTGRRKMVMEIVIFLAVYGGLLIYFRRGAVKLALFLGAIAAVSFFSQALLFPEEGQVTYQPYFTRSYSVFEDATNRLKTMLIDAPRWSIARHGFFGVGAGMGSQGAQHFGVVSGAVSGGAEGGFGKILAELGVPGLVLFLWVVGAFARTIWKALELLAMHGDKRSSTVAIGFAAFLIANMAVYVNATQIYGDPFVLLMLGLMLGFILAMPLSKVAFSETAERSDVGRQTLSSATGQ